MVFLRQRQSMVSLAGLTVGWLVWGNAAVIAAPGGTIEAAQSTLTATDSSPITWAGPGVWVVQPALPKPAPKPTRGGDLDSLTVSASAPSGSALGGEVSPSGHAQDLAAPQASAPAQAAPSDDAGTDPETQPEATDFPPADPELGIIQVRDPQGDPELGILRVRDQPSLPPSSESDKIGFLSARFSVVNSDNVLLLVNDVGALTGDTFYRPAVTLAVYPSLGPQTALIGSLDLGLQRYSGQSTLNYDDWQARIALRQGLSPRSYVQLGATYQELWRAGESRFRFFDNRSLALTLGRRDPLTPQLTLDSFYRFQWNQAQAFAQPGSGLAATDFSRLSHTAGAYLGYTLSPQWHTGVNYQLSLTDYKGQDRHDTVQQLLGQAVYSLTPQVRFSLYGGWTFGRSSEPRLRFDDAVIGITLDATVPLF